MPILSNFTYPKRLPGRCATNTETSAVKQPAGATPKQAWQRCSFFIEASQPQKSTEGAKRCAWWQQWPVVLRRLALCVPLRLTASSYFFQHGGGRQAMRRTPNPRRCGSVTHPPCHFSKWCNRLDCTFRFGQASGLPHIRARGVEELHGRVAAPAAVPSLLRPSLNCAIAQGAAHSR